MKTVTMIAAAATALMASGAGATVLYDNGAFNGTLGDPNISSFEVANSFTVSSDATAIGALFYSLDTEGAGVTSIFWEIATGSPGSFASVASGTVSVTSVNEGVDTSFDLTEFKNTISFSPGVSLTSGTTYWLILTSAEVAGGDGGAFMDRNNGPSTAWSSGAGILAGSDSFEILGPDTATPEPTTWALMLAGFAGLGAALRSRRGMIAAG